MPEVLKILLAGVQIAKLAAPALPHLVTDVKVVVADAEKAAADIKALDPSATIADVSKIFADLSTDEPTFAALIKESASLVL